MRHTLVAQPPNSAAATAPNPSELHAPYLPPGGQSPESATALSSPSTPSFPFSKDPIAVTASKLCRTCSPRGSPAHSSGRLLRAATPTPALWLGVYTTSTCPTPPAPPAHAHALLTAHCGASPSSQDSLHGAEGAPPSRCPRQERSPGEHTSSPASSPKQNTPLNFS